jgi:hypothetical protein
MDQVKVYYTWNGHQMASYDELLSIVTRNGDKLIESIKKVVEINNEPKETATFYVVMK